MTNFERIKNMAVDELAAFIQDAEYCSKCSYCIGRDENYDYVCGSINEKFSPERNYCVIGCTDWLNKKTT